MFFHTSNCCYCTLRRILVLNASEETRTNLIGNIFQANYDARKAFIFLLNSPSSGDNIFISKLRFLRAVENGLILLIASFL
jgi:hypothetical protein